MITDRLSRLLATAAPGARAHGLVDGAVTLRIRHREKRAAWAPHLEATRAVIRDHLKLAEPSGPIVVLGAGLCRDLPLDALDAHPAGARLVDVVLLPEIRLKLRGFPRVRFELHDVTGLLARRAPSAPRRVFECPSPAPLRVEGAGMIVSVNLLSQLVLPFAHSPPDDDFDRTTADRLFRAHLAALREAPCPVLLVTDTARVEDRDGAVSRLDTVPVALVDECLGGRKVAGWDWNVSPMGELARGLAIRFEVGAWLKERG